MHSTFVSAGTVLTLVLGLALAAGYLLFMWRALQRAIESRDDPDRGKDRYARSFIGAIVAVFGSVGAIASYGLGALSLCRTRAGVAERGRRGALPSRRGQRAGRRLTLA